MKLRYGIPFVLLSVSLSVSADPGRSIVSIISGQQLLDQCGAAMTWYNGNTRDMTPDQRVQAVECTSYISGALDQLQSVWFMALPPHEYECYKQSYAGVNVQQTIRVVYQYLSSHPETLNNAAAPLIYLAVGKAFPIPKECAAQPSSPTLSGTLRHWKNKASSMASTVKYYLNH